MFLGERVMKRLFQKEFKNMLKKSRIKYQKLEQEIPAATFSCSLVIT
jgi:hypothetical protein